jgi:hypothetical protein
MDLEELTFCFLALGLSDDVNFAKKVMLSFLKNR